MRSRSDKENETAAARSTDELDRIGGGKELKVAARRPDGVLRRPVPMIAPRARVTTLKLSPCGEPDGGG